MLAVMAARRQAFTALAVATLLACAPFGLAGQRLKAVNHLTPSEAKVDAPVFVIARVPFMGYEQALRLGDQLAYKLQDIGCARASKRIEELADSDRDRRSEVLEIWSKPEGRTTTMWVTFRHETKRIDQKILCGTLGAEQCAQNELKLEKIADTIRQHHRECHQKTCTLTNQRSAF